MNKPSYAFITGMGRSGTSFLTKLLNKDKDHLINHEYIGNKEFYLASWYLGRAYSYPYLMKEKERIDQQRNGSLFVDVNSYLANSTDQLKEVFDSPLIFHLVRNPLEVCRSLLIRRDDNQMHKIPKEQKEIEIWLASSKLEQICINWKQNTDQLLYNNTQLIRFEDIISNYQYVEERILMPLGITITKADFEEVKSRKVNKTHSQLYRFVYAKFKGKKYISGSANYKLNTTERKTIVRICGETMEKLGYDPSTD